MDVTYVSSNEMEPCLARNRGYLQEDDSCLWKMINTLCCPCGIFCSLNQVNPQEVAVVTKFGRVVEEIKEPDLYILLPIGTDIKKVYMGQQSTEVKEQVNDLNGSPIVLSTQLIYKVTNASSYLFSNSDFSRFLKDQALSTMKEIAGRYPYDSISYGEKGNKEACLRASSEEINYELAKKLSELISGSGVEIVSFRIGSVAYDKTMEGVLLLRQEAQAQVDAKNTLANGISSVVTETITKLEKDGNLNMSQEQKVAATTNLLYILTSHGPTSLNVFPIPLSSVQASVLNSNSQKK